MKRKTKAYINGFLLLITLVINGLGASGVINGLSQKEISDMYQTLITPAPSTFSIWSVIYTLLIISIVLMIIKQDVPYYKRAIDEISKLFWLSCVLNAVWIITFSYTLIGLSTIFIFAFLLVMLFIMKRVGKIQTRKRCLLPTTFGLYAGWLLIATVVNLAAWFVKINWNYFGISNELWSIIMLSIATLLTLLALLKLKNAILPLPVAWGYLGIYKFLLAPEGFQGTYDLLQKAALLGIFILVIGSIVQFYKNQYNIMPNV